MLYNKKIRDMSGNQYSFEELIVNLNNYEKEEYSFYIGTDSQVYLDKVSVVTCVCTHKPGSTGKVYYVKEAIPLKQCQNLRTRMLMEAYRSIEAAMELDELVKSKLTIHLDVGETDRSTTSLYYKELQGLVKAQGYDCSIKPDSWASSSVADKVIKS